MLYDVTTLELLVRRNEVGRGNDVVRRNDVGDVSTTLTMLYEFLLFN